ncbi:MAG: filamentous hemagglutinin N-terminal domain-containing protein, partial [Alphaproteobacteria bacterium]|nr:filamentous hemagglutinin N-terminal domain-containing protein [Alphaproteobacteria bacterium]
MIDKPVVFGKIKIAARNAVCYYLSAFMIIQPVLATGVVIDGNSGSTHICPHSGNIPILNINAPTRGGVSHNRFTEFNVDENGLIINNSNFRNYNPHARSVLTGEHIEFNRNFGTGDAARVILNEVVSNSVSMLAGQTEIFGQQADLIIANPNGITCVGCGFINTGRLSLITGTPTMTDDGRIQNFDISGTGMLHIKGVGTTHFGMFAPSHADLVSSMVKIAGQIHANGDVTILTGNDVFDYENRIVTSNATHSIEVAIDSTAVGGIFANNIRIHATQEGFGIRTNGNLVADMGNVKITADGDIVMRNAAASEDIIIRSESANVIARDGYMYARNINIYAGNDFRNETIIRDTHAENIVNYLIAHDNINITTGRDIYNAGRIQTGGNFNATTGRDFHNFGRVLGNNLTFTVHRDLINYREAAILAAGDINFNIGRDMVNFLAEIFALGNITFAGIEGASHDPSGIENQSYTRFTNNPYATEWVPPELPEIEFIPLPEESYEPTPIYFILEDGTVIIIPPNTFDEYSPLGKYATYGDYTVFVGRKIITITYEDVIDHVSCDEYDVCSNVYRREYTTRISFTDDDYFTIVDTDNNFINFSIRNPEDNYVPGQNNPDEYDYTTASRPGEIERQEGDGEYHNDALDNNWGLFDGIDFNNEFLGTLLNWGGRIESGQNIEINAEEVINRGFLLGYLYMGLRGHPSSSTLSGTNTNVRTWVRENN